MSEEVPPSVIKNVQDALSRYVKKPPLSEKLLKKPPFRYLHDIVHTVTKETNFLGGIYTAEELDSNNVKDKESKIAFLEKLIASVKAATGRNITARPSKIVAGLEVVKTLELLQALGEAIDVKNAVQQVTSNAAPPPESRTTAEKKDQKASKPNKTKEVAAKQTTRINKTKPADKNAAEKISNGIEQKRATVADGRRNSVANRRESLKKEASIESAASDSIKDSTDTKSSSLDKSKPNAKENGIIANKRPSVQSKSTHAQKSSSKDINRSSVINSSKNSQPIIKEQQENKSQTLKKESQKQVASRRNDTKRKSEGSTSKNKLSAEGEDKVKNSISDTKNDQTAAKLTTTKTEGKKQDLKESTNGLDEAASNEQSIQKKESGPAKRPTSARPGTRKLVHDDFNGNSTGPESTSVYEKTEKNNANVQNQNSIRPRTATRPASARPGAPRIRDRGEVQVAEETVSVTNPVNVIEEGIQDQFGDDKEGFITVETEQIATQLEETTELNEADQGQLVHQILKTQKELNEGVAGDIAQNKHLEIEWEAGRQRERDSVSKEIEKTRNAIQNLTSAANPLGKLFDFLQEDVDEMQRELQHWKSVSEKFQKQQQAELELAKVSLQPLRKQLLDVENSIQDEYAQIANIKTTILANDARILKLASGTGPIKSRVK